MSKDPFDELPEQFRRAIREMMKKLQEIDPEELEQMMNQMFGEEFVEKMRDFSLQGGGFSFSTDPSTMKNFESMMRNFMHNNPQASPFSEDMDEPQEEEPYYEITPLMENEGQIIVELPGITDVRMVKWDRTSEGIDLEAETEDIVYKVSIPLDDSFMVKDVFAEVKNSVFILPYKGE